MMINKIKQRLERATGGQWTYKISWQESKYLGTRVMQGGGIISDIAGGTLVCHFGDDEQYDETGGEPPNASDLEFILNAKTDIVFLLSEIERLKQGKDNETTRLSPPAANG